MGMTSEILVIGHFKLLKSLDVLSYPDDHYDDVRDNDMVEGTLGGADTSRQSYQLAELFGIDPWDLGNHLITQLPSYINYGNFEEFDGQDPKEIIEKARKLLLDPTTIIFFRPNG
jgi:hypothetical protein